MDAQQSQQLGGMIAGIMGVIVLIGLVFLAFIVFLLWRIFTKAGLSGALSLLVLIPGFGSLVVLCVLAFADWKVIPAPTASPYYPPTYPPPPPPPPAFQPPPAA
jgi:uncharacterized membrane protein YhaH (DUF805 family)